MIRPPRPSLRFCATAIACAAITACTSPTSLRQYRDPEATAAPTPPRVAIIPPAFTVQIDGAGDVTEADREAIRRQAEEYAMTFAVAALRERGYEPTLADAALAQGAVRTLAEGFVYHANAVASGAPEGGYLDPALVAQVAGGADAVLYVNSSAVTVSAGKVARQVVAAVFIAVVIVAIVVLAILASRDGRGASASTGGAHVGVPVSGGERVVAAPPPPVYRSAVYLHWSFSPIFYIPLRPREPEPAYRPPPRAADRGLFSGSELRLFATLADAVTGRILWHADHTVGNDVSNAAELRRSIEAAFASLPERLSARR